MNKLWINNKLIDRLAMLQQTEIAHPSINLDSEYGKEALADRTLYDTIVEHRRTYYALKYVNYDLHNPSTINFMIPDQERNVWMQDYADMQRFFIYGTSLEFGELMKRMEDLQRQLHLMQNA